MATEQVYLLLFGSVVLVVVFVAVLLLAIKRLRRRKAQLLSELKDSPRLNSDRAFNRLEMARREAEILSNQGTEVGRGRELIAQSQSAFDLRQFERAYELAQSAHESLVVARQGGTPFAPLPASDPMTPRSGPRIPSGVAGATPTTASSSTQLPLPATTGPPRNRIESQFEMRLLDEELERSKRTGPSDAGRAAGVDFQGKARSAFDAGQFTDALRFALKGRRSLGGNVESVASGPASRMTESGGTPIDPARAAERAASAARCPSCGYPTTPDDVFCRGCGAPRTATTCPRCGIPRTPADTFCGRCGERFS